MATKQQIEKPIEVQSLSFKLSFKELIAFSSFLITLGAGIAGYSYMSNQVTSMKTDLKETNIKISEHSEKIGVISNQVNRVNKDIDKLMNKLMND